MYPEDMLDPGTYVDAATGDIWEKRVTGKWFVNGMPHKPFPHSLVPEQRVDNMPAVSINDAVADTIARKLEAMKSLEDWRTVKSYPKYEVLRTGSVRYKDSKVMMAPSMQDAMDSYYPLIGVDMQIHMVPLKHIIDEAFPEEI